QHFARLCQILDEAGVKYVINSRLVRGLDYYGLTVFEWVTQSLGAQGTVCGGGRYNTLVERLGGKPTPAIGFAMGIERVIALLEQKAIAHDQSTADVYLVAAGSEAMTQAILVSEQLRELCELRVLCNTDEASFKSQLKRADKSGARWAVIIGEDELKDQSALIKDLKTGEQVKITLAKVLTYFKENYV
ncbi:MAG TPA: His/Gly/Thr/Pro-type tRNA ligase C-terminal domain-containing protein, partial [Coxiellaceae bacterium]|nr:His/Gly/Thr/Pro-type tRNA ligase C-terminal domain-containing protein [Coxiellaceae bacterium]